MLLEVVYVSFTPEDDDLKSQLKNLLEQAIPSKSFRLGQVLLRVKYSFNLVMPKKEKKMINQTRLALGEHVSQTKTNQSKTFSCGVNVHHFK